MNLAVGGPCQGFVTQKGLILLGTMWASQTLERISVPNIEDESIFFFVIVRFYFILREREREGEREGEKHQMVASHTPPAGNLAHNPGLCPGPEWNPQPFRSKADARSTELHPPGLKVFSD